MEIKTKDLRATLKILSGVVQKGSITPELDGVLIKSKSITGGNTALTIKLPFENQLPDGIILDFETLLKTANSLNGLLKVKQLDKVVEFKGDNGKINVPIIFSDSGYPVITPELKHKEFSLTFDEVTEISRLSNFIDPKGRYLGIYYNGKTFASTNAAMCGFYDKITDKDISVSVYPEIYKALLPIPADQFTFKDGTIKAVLNGKVTAAISYVDLQENPPNFDQITPKNMPATVTATAFDFKSLIELLSVSVSQKTNIAELNWLPLSLKGKSKEVENNKESEGEIETDSRGLDEPIRMGLNIKYFEMCINYINSENVSVNMEAQNKALILTGDDVAKRCLLMPFVI